MLLEVINLTKKYPKFILQNISFSLHKGKIMGLIGKNGAGKSTTLKSILNMVSYDSGTIKIFNQKFKNEEAKCKQKIGVVLGGINFYQYKKLSSITAVTRRFYQDWDNSAYTTYMNLFELDSSKRVNQLSAGMKVKYLIALALSHHADLLIFDEPTSGLDPVAREDLLDLFKLLVSNGKRSILFSTHIISDLDKCADYITYLKNGELLLSENKETFIKKFNKSNGCQLSLEEIMINLERGQSNA